ncbi:MAG TPA: DinB family protein [Chitinophagaceae bacterium]|nr:DinB family protein [Chitinophagaceae bacterium]
MPLSASILGRLEHQHETVHELIKGFPEQQLKHRVNPDKWSAFEQLVHLAAYQPVFQHRMVQVEQQHQPAFERYVADNDPVFHTSLARTVKELEDDIATQRFIIYNHIRRLNETSLRRTALHPKYGELTVVQWTEFFLLHESHHLFAIFMLTAELRKMFQQ